MFFGKQSAGDKKSATSAASAHDATVVIVKEGVLKKKNSKGQWKERQCRLTVDAFTGTKIGSKVDKDDVKENVDVKLIREVILTSSTVIEISLLNDDAYTFQALSPKDASDWVAAFEGLLQTSGDHIAPVHIVYDSSDPNKVYLKGKLSKKSHNKFQTSMQERFVRIQGSNVYYLKNENDGKEAGCIDLKKVDFIRRASSDSPLFELLEGDRVYEFAAGSIDEAKRWVEVLQLLRKQIQSIEDAAAAASAAAVSSAIQPFSKRQSTLVAKRLSSATTMTATASANNTVARSMLEEEDETESLGHEADDVRQSIASRSSESNSDRRNSESLNFIKRGSSFEREASVSNVEIQKTISLTAAIANDSGDLETDSGTVPLDKLPTMAATAIDADNALASGFDFSAFPRLEGVLFKKNSKGGLKERYCLLTHDRLFAKTAKESKENIDVKTIEKAVCPQNASLAHAIEVRLVNGDTMLFFAANTMAAASAGSAAIELAAKWRNAINHRIARSVQAIAEAAATASFSENAANGSGRGSGDNHGKDALMSGWLLKKSHNKLQTLMQERFVKIVGSNLMYFKGKSDDKASGSMLLGAGTSVRPFDLSADCCTFEVHDRSRALVFQAETPAEMHRWVAVVSAVHQSLLEAEANKQRMAIPEPIRVFDEDGIDAFVMFVRDELAEVYPPVDDQLSRSGDERLQNQRTSDGSSDGASDGDDDDKKAKEEDDGETAAFDAHLRCLKALMRHVDSLCAMLRANTASARSPGSGHNTIGSGASVAFGPRFDVLAVFLSEANEFVYQRLRRLVAVSTDPNCMIDGSLLRLHGLIVALTDYQNLLRRNVVPVQAASNADVLAYLDVPHADTGRERTANSCELCTQIPLLCTRYVEGDGSASGSFGSAEHMMKHCLSVWRSLLKAPVEMIQRHIDGTFFTHTPSDMWQAVNQHLALATATKSVVLRVMLVDKIVAALMQVTSEVSEFVETLDTSKDRELREVELEFLCAMANDNALHIEEVIALIDSFDNDEIRSRVNSLFDPLTLRLVQCGQTCLRSIFKVLMRDLQTQLDEVMTEAWLDGRQVDVVTATLADYFQDLRSFLMPFWGDKLVLVLLEGVVLAYARAVLLNNKSALSAPLNDVPNLGYNANNSDADHEDNSDDATSQSPAQSQSGGALRQRMRGFMQRFGRNKQGNPSNNGDSNSDLRPSNFVTKSPTRVFVPAFKNASVNSESSLFCRADPESLGRLAQDANVLNSFFHKHAGQDAATEFLELLNDLSLFLFVEPERIGFHGIARISEFPSAAQAISEVITLCIRLRDDISRIDYERILTALSPALSVADESAAAFAAEGVAEGRLGLLYADLLPADVTKQTMTKETLARRLKDMANLNLGKLKKALLDDEDEDDTCGDNGGNGEGAAIDRVKLDPEKAKKLAEQRSAAVAQKTAHLLDDVLDVLSHEAEDQAIAVAEAEDLRLRQEQLAANVRSASINIEAKFDKKSPAHNLWQGRWFKLSTRVIPAQDDDDDDRYVYTLMWFKSKGGSVLKAIDCSTIVAVRVTEADRTMCYLPQSGVLCLESEVAELSAGTSSFSAAIPVIGGSAGSVTGVIAGIAGNYVFTVTTTDGKEIELKTTKADKLALWVNSLLQAAHLRYDASRGAFV